MKGAGRGMRKSAYAYLSVSLPLSSTSPLRYLILPLLDIPPFVASPYSRDAIRSTNVNKNVSELFVNCPALFATCEQRGEQPAGSYVVLPSERRLDFLLVADVAFMK